MGGLMRFLLGGVLGVVLGFFLSRARGGTARKGPATRAGDYFPAPGAELASVVPEPALAETADEVPDHPPMAESVGLSEEPTASPSVAEWTPTVDWPPAEEELIEEGDSAFDWGPEDEPISAADLPGETAEEEIAQEPETVSGDNIYPPLAASVPPVSPTVGEGTGRPLVSAEELRTRIEESRRRIRQELEEPFLMPAHAVEEPLAPPLSTEPLDAPRASDESFVVTRGPEAPFVMPALAPEAIAGADLTPEAWEEPSPTIEVQPADESLYTELGVRIERATPPGGESDDLRSRIESARLASEDVLKPSPEELEISLSYDAMRARIEDTRNRLRAKAMDARTPSSMAQGADTTQGASPYRDSADTEAEVAARIDSLLSETND